MGKGVAEWTDRRLNDLAAALEPVPGRVAVLEATVDHLTVELESVPTELAVLAAAVDRLAEENRKRRRSVKPSSTAAELAAVPSEESVAVELRRISEQLREQRGL